MRKYCCKGLEGFIKKGKYGAGLSSGDTSKIMISVIREMSNDLKTCMNIVIRYCPFCGKKTDIKSGKE